MATKRKAAPTEKKQSSSDAVDEQLERYRSMRDFKVTAEPSGGTQPTKGAKAEPPVCHPETRGDASPLRLPPRLERRAEELGLLPKAQAMLSPISGSPSRSKITPWSTAASKASSQRPVWRRHSDALGPGHLGAAGGHTDVDEGLRTGSLKFILHGRKDEGQMGADPHGRQRRQRDRSPTGC
jgi:bifunctional non-homologous end joining protein LigD